MKDIENNALFWQKLDTLLLSSTIKINRPKGEHHPEYPALIFPVNYGVLKDTSGTGTQEIDIFVGSQKIEKVQAIAVSTDILRKNIEVKLVVGCSNEEVIDILEYLNSVEFQKAVLIHRGDNVPEWSE